MTQFRRLLRIQQSRLFVLCWKEPSVEHLVRFRMTAADSHTICYQPQLDLCFRHQMAVGRSCEPSMSRNSTSLDTNFLNNKAVFVSESSGRWWRITPVNNTAGCLLSLHRLRLDPLSRLGGQAMSGIDNRISYPLIVNLILRNAHELVNMKKK